LDDNSVRIGVFLPVLQQGSRLQLLTSLEVGITNTKVTEVDEKLYDPEQGTQYTFNATMRRLCVTIVALERH
jgi:hypothetical protein